MNDCIWGLIECAGQGSRMAADLGAGTPYPKHLQRIGKQSLLELSIHTMTNATPVDCIVVDVSDQWAASYIRELDRIHQDIPVPLQWRIQSSRNIVPIGNVTQPHLDTFQDGSMTIMGWGEVFTPDDISWVKPHITRFITMNKMPFCVTATSDPLFSTGGVFYVCQYPWFDYARPLIALDAYGDTRIWNINHTSDLVEARQWYGYDEHNGPYTRR